MKAALGGGYLLNIVVAIVSVVMLLFVGVLAYSKAYRIKNRIVEVIENNNGYNDDAIAVLNKDLQKSGYTTTRENGTNYCEDNLNETSYKYCVTGPVKVDNGEYYKVITYTHFEFPFIGSVLNIPVKGETKILNKNYDY